MKIEVKRLFNGHTTNIKFEKGLGHEIYIAKLLLSVHNNSNFQKVSTKGQFPKISKRLVPKVTTT